MRDNVEIILERQLGIRRLIDQKKIALKLVAADSGIPYETLLTYFPQEGASRKPAQIPGGAVFALCGALPAELLSLLLPEGFQIVRAPEAIDHDRVAELAADYLAAKNAAHHPESEAGRDLGPTENRNLTGKLVELKVAA